MWGDICILGSVHSDALVIHISKTIIQLFNQLQHCHRIYTRQRNITATMGHIS